MKHSKAIEYNLNCHISIMLGILDDKALIQSISNVAEVMVDCLTKGGMIAFCGNGGSASQAQHFAAELMGRFIANRKPYKAIALTADTAVLTTIANDYDFYDIFARQVEGLLCERDCLVILSTSGASPNCIRACYEANRQGITSVAITGEPSPNNICDRNTDHSICIPAVGAARIQEATLVIGHIICGIIEQELQ